MLSPLCGCTTGPHRLGKVIADVRNERVLVAVVIDLLLPGGLAPSEDPAGDDAAGAARPLEQLGVHEGGLGLDVLDLGEEAEELLDQLLDARVLRLVVPEAPVDTLAVEGVRARKHVELLLEDALGAEVALLGGIDGDVLVALLPLLLAQLLRGLRVLRQLLLQIEDLRVVLVEALTQVLLHILDLGVLGEEGQQVVDLEDRILQDFEGLRHVHLLRRLPGDRRADGLCGKELIGALL